MRRHKDDYKVQIHIKVLSWPQNVIKRTYASNDIFTLSIDGSSRILYTFQETLLLRKFSVKTLDMVFE